MLNGGTLDGAHLEVTSAAAPAVTAGSTSLPTDASASTPIGASASSGVDEHGISQEDKPKAGIMAECTSLPFSPCFVPFH